MNTSACPHCHSPMRPRKWGRTRSGSQRLRCPTCCVVYNAAPKRRGYPAALRRQAVSLAQEGMNLRHVGRLLGVHHQSVANWVKAAQAQQVESVVET